MTKNRQQKSGGQLLHSVPEMKDWHAIVGIVLLVAFFFRDILLKNAFFWEDFMYYYYPARNFASVSMAGGEIPLWNPFTFNGMPFQADIQTALFYLPNLLLTLFVSDGRLSFYWLEVEIVFHYIIAGVCMYYLARSYGLQRVFAFFSGIVFALSGFMITRAIHQPMICETAWLPLIVLLFKKTLEKRSVKAMLLTGLVLGHAMLAGFPQLTLYIFFLLLLYGIFECVRKYSADGIKPTVAMILLAGGVVVISLAIAAIQLLPTIELAPYTQRAEMTYQKSIDGSLSVPGLITLVVPKFFGAFGAQGSNLWLEGSYGQYWETCVYVGIAGLVCVVFAGTLMKQNKEVAFLFGIVVFSLLYALGDSFILHKLFFKYVPAFDKFREPGRLSFLWTFAAALLSGFGLRRIFELSEENKTLLIKILMGIALCGVVLWIAVQQGIFQSVRDQRMYPQIHEIAASETTAGLILLLLVCFVIFLRRRGTFSITATLVFLIGTQCIDMHVFGFNQNNGKVNPDEYFSKSSQIVSMVKEQQEVFRVNSRSGNAMIWDRNQGMMDRVFTMEGYSSLVLQRIYPPAKDREHVDDLMNAKYYIVVDEKGQSMTLGRSSTYVPRAYMVYNARIIKDDAEQKSFMTSDAFDPRRTVVLEDDLPPLPPSTDSLQTAGTVNITSYHLNSIEMNVVTPRSGFLSLSEIYYPAWKAYIDGIEHPVYRANWNLRALFVEAGTHHVMMRYEPESFSRGAWITFVTLGVTFVGLILSQRKSQQSGREGNA